MKPTLGAGIALFLTCAATAAPAPSDKRTLSGDFVWSGGGDGELEAIFTPTGDETWDVDFRFTFSGTPHVYSGTAEGTLAGALKGKVKSDGRNRTFTFRGTFTDGVFAGTHAEITGAGEHATGTLTLRE